MAAATMTMQQPRSTLCHSPMGLTRTASDRAKLESERRVSRLTGQLADLKRMSDAMEASCSTWMCGAVKNMESQQVQQSQVPLQSQLAASLLRSASSYRRKVCVVGGGSSGVVCVKELLEAGVEDVVCYECQEGPGGLYRRDNYEYGCHTSSFCYTSFACYPPEDVSQCGHYTLSGYVKYLESFVEAFELGDYIKFKHKVLKVGREFGADQGDWLVTIENLSTKAVFTQRFEHLIIASGTHTNKNDPSKTYEWLKDFDGQVLHSSDYRSAKSFAGKRVVVVGGGESASDIAVQTAKVASKTWLATRARTGHVTPRGPHLPLEDHDSSGRLEAHKKAPDKVLPDAGFDNDLSWSMYSTSNFFFPLHGYRDVMALATKDFFPGCKLNVYNKSNVDSQYGCKNAGFSSAIARFGMVPKPPIRKCEKFTRRVHFEDGSVVDEIDSIIVCVGYRNDIVFLDDQKIKKKILNPRNCMKHIAHPEISNLYMVGFVRPAFGNIPSIAELQAKWISQLISNKTSLPSKDDMHAIIEEDRDWEESHYKISGGKLKALTSYYRKLMDLGELTDTHPDYGKLLLEDPALFLKIVVGQFSGFHFRLRDPDPDVRKRYRSLIMKMPLAHIWAFDLAIVATAFHFYLLLGGFGAFKLRGKTPFQQLHPVSRRALAFILLLNPLYLLLFVFPCFLVTILQFLVVNLNSVRISSNLDGLRRIDRPAHYLLKSRFDSLHVLWARAQTVFFLLLTMPFDLMTTLFLKKHLLDKSDMPTSKFMAMENNYKKQISDFAFA